MDPNANLSEQLTLARCILDANGSSRQYHLQTGRDLDEDVVQLAELVQALNGWITKGGFLPSAWTPKP